MKILIFLGLLGSVGSAVLAVMARSSLKDLRVQKDSLNRDTLEIHTGVNSKIGDIAATNATFTVTAKSAKDEDLATKVALSEIKTKEANLEATKKETAEIAGRMQSMAEDIKRLIGSSGGTPEELASKTEALKTENDAKVKELDQIAKEAEVAKKAAAESQSLVSRLKQQQATRALAINLASRSGTISAVNPEFGFVIVNLGSNQGVSNESRLLVKRGSQLVGKLKIVQIEGNTTVADIDIKSITAGFSIQPGDEVIFENSPT